MLNKKSSQSYLLWTTVVFVLILTTVVFLLPARVFGADDLYGVNYGAGVGLASEDLRVTVVKVIRAILGALGVVALVLVLYAGFVWMTSGGSQEKIGRAKKIMVNAVIGLVIIMMAFAIVQYVFKVLSGEGSGDPGGPAYCQTDSCSGCLRCVDQQNYHYDTTCDPSCTQPPGGTTSFRIEDVQTSHGAPLAANGLSIEKSNVYSCSKIQTVFNRDVDVATVESVSSDPVSPSDALRIAALSGASETITSGSWNTYGNAIVFTPANNTFQITDNLHVCHTPTAIKDLSDRNLSGCALSAGCDGAPPPDYRWNFYVGSEGDDNHPTITRTYPTKDQPYDRNVSPADMIEVYFSENIDAATVFTASGSLTPDSRHFVLEELDQNGQVVGTVNNNILAAKVNDNNSPTGFHVSLVSPNTLKTFTRYRVTVSGIGDLCGNVMEPVSVQWEFTTNDRLPGVGGNYPTGTNVCPDTHPTVNFNTSMYENFVEFTITDGGSYQANYRLLAHQTTVSNTLGTFRVADVGDPTSPNYNFSDHYLVYEFIPSQPLRANTSYHISVVTDKILDTNRNVLTKAWDFSVTDLQNCVCVPYLSGLSQTQGPVGDCLTLYGQCFKGTAASPASISAINFGTRSAFVPPVANYQDDYIATTVPDGFSPGDRPDISVRLAYQSANGTVPDSNSLGFLVTIGTANGPCLWSINPNSGNRGDQVEFTGIRFGSYGATHEAHFTPAATAVNTISDATNWTDTSVTGVLVPATALDGPAYLRTDRGISNSIPFNVNFCGDGGLDPGEECDGGNVNGQTCLDFGFAGGSLSCDSACKIVKTACSNAPVIVENGTCQLVCQGGDRHHQPCSANQDCLGTDPTPDGTCVIAAGGLPSPNPRPGATNVCLNAALSAEFGVDLNTATLTSANIYLQRCRNVNCADDNTDPANVVPGVEDAHLSANLAVAGLRGFVLTPSASLTPNTTYQVTLGKNITGANGQAMLSDYHWHFTTKNSTAPCPLDNIYIEPRDLTVTSANTPISFVGHAVAPLASTNCTLINGGGYTWVWAVADDNTPPIGVNLTGGGPAVTVTSGSVSGTVKVKAETEGEKDETDFSVFIDTCTTSAECHARCAGSTCDIPTKHCTPVINSVSPSSGPEGSWVTLSGCFFKNDRGSGNVRLNGEIVSVYPCGETWTDDHIIIQIPSLHLGVGADYDVVVTDQYGLRSNRGSFIKSATCVGSVPVPATGFPGLCSLEPDTGRWGETVSLAGENLGTSATGAVTFAGSAGRLTATGATWSGTTSIRATVPVNTVNGLTSVSVAGCQSNGLPFTLAGGGVGSSCDQNNAPACQQPDQSLCWPGLVCNHTSCLCETPGNANVITASLSPTGNSVCRNALVRTTFDQIMDRSTLNNDTVKIWSETLTTCPTPVQVTLKSSNFLVRVWHKIKNIFYPSQAEAAAGNGISCPLAGTISSYNVGAGAESCANQDGCTVVTFTPRGLMETSGGDYTITILGGANGVKTALGGGLNTNVNIRNLGAVYQWGFRVGTEVCQIDHVDINIRYRSGNREATRAKASRDYFTCAERDNCPDDIQPTIAGNQHEYLAAAKSQDDQTLQALYAWTENDPDNLVGIATANVATTNISPTKKSGEASVSVTASDFDIHDDLHYGTSTASVAITNFICENPWPSLSAGFPFTDSAGNCRSGSGSCTNMTFSTYYCRDAGLMVNFCLAGTKAGQNCTTDSDCSGSRCVAPTVDDLPGLDYVINGQSAGYCVGGSSNGQVCSADGQCSAGGYCYNTLKDYLFVMSAADKKKCALSNATCALDADCQAGDSCLTNTDSLGIRIYNNAEHLSPVAWASKYEKNPASGSTSIISGYEALSAGRTNYINMAVDTNPSGGHNIFTNMFLLSHTDNPKSVTTAIYDQLLKNLVFNSNGLYNNRICQNAAGNSTGIYCTKDSDCGVGETCDADQDKLARDVIRMGHLKQMVYYLDKYRGTCSENANLPCRTDADCPGGAKDACSIAHGTYPTLSAGTYLAGQSVSVWDSWQQTFAQTLGNSPLKDPLNKPANCPADYNDECWNQATKNFQCNPGSYMYHYQVMSGGASYRLFANMEYSPTGWNPSDTRFSTSVSSPCQPGTYDLMFTRQ